MHSHHSTDSRYLTPKMNGLSRVELRADKREGGNCVAHIEMGRVGEDTFEMYLRYRYRYMRGCIFSIFQTL